MGTVELSLGQYPELARLLQRWMPESSFLIGCLRRILIASGLEPVPGPITNGHPPVQRERDVQATLYANRWPSPAAVVLLGREPSNSTWSVVVLELQSQQEDSGGRRPLTDILDFLGSKHSFDHLNIEGVEIGTTECVRDWMRRQSTGSPRFQEVPCTMVVATDGWFYEKTDGSPQIGPLTIADSPLISQNWDFGDAEEVQYLIRHFYGAGIRACSTGQLVAWAIIQPYGAIGTLHVSKTQRRNGYASLLVKHLASVLQERKILPYAFIVDGNEASASFFKRLGFEEVSGKFVWITVDFV